MWQQVTKLVQNIECNEIPITFGTEGPPTFAPTQPETKISRLNQRKNLLTYF
jgi:hypothetical protein